jgi:CubicO group peptidase (beta-lactamase class C family)
VPRRNPATDKLDIFDAAGRESRFIRPPGFPSASGGLVSTADDHLAFARMILNKGEHGAKRLLSERSVALMATDHITAQQKAASPFVPGFWHGRGWGYALSVIKEPAPGDARSFGWDGGYGTSCYWDPQSGLVGILLPQRLWESPVPPPVRVDFWRFAYKAIGA